MNVNDGSQTVSPIYPAGHIASDSARLMGNNVYGFRNDNNNPQHPINDWFYKFDRGSQSFTDYRDQTIFTNTNAPFVWLGTKDMKSIVYMVSSWPGGGVTSNTLYKFNLETSTRTELKLNDNLKNAQTRIVGWNGNEENVILWDNSNIFWNLNTTTDELTQITG